MKKLLLLLNTCIIYNASAQLIVTPKTAAQADSVVRNNFITASSVHSISNVVYTGDNLAYGTFSSGGVGIPSGILLTTGLASSVAADPSTQNDFDQTTNGDADLQTLTSTAITDAASIQFDIVPKNDTLLFRLVFGSEDYDEYVCANLVDVLGIFVTGTNPAGGTYANQNFALIPGTSLPISVNSINPGVPGSASGGGTCTGAGQSLAYSSLYVLNAGTTVIYDGYTTVLDIRIPVVICESYHLKFAIGDVLDGFYDSGVFLQSGTVTAKQIHINATSLQSVSVTDTTFLCLNDTATLEGPYGYSYSWSNGDTSKTTQVTAAGTYNLIISNVNNFCFAASVPYHIITDSTCSVASIAETDNGFSIYPNPFSDVLHITSQQHAGFTYLIADVTGKIRLQGRLSDDHFDEARLSVLKDGIYILNISDGGNSYYYRLIKSVTAR